MEKTNMEEIEHRAANTFKKVVKEIKRRAKEGQNNTCYCFGHYQPSKSQKKLERICFKGNIYTCMLKYENHSPFIESQIECAEEYYCDMNEDEDYEASTEEIVDQIVYCMKHDDTIYMLKMKIE